MSSAAPLPRTQRERQRADTRERIYEAALEEFRRVGCARAQIDRIARAAGVVRGSFYFHFARKEHVLLELQTRLERRAVARLAPLRHSPASLRELLLAVVDTILDGEQTAGDPGLFRDMLALYVRPPDDPAIDGRDFPLVRELAALLREAAGRGALRPDLDPDRLTVMFLTSVFGSLIAGDPLPARRRADLEFLVETFLGGVQP